MTSFTSTPEPQPKDKATLYCPECGHESHINGDWIIHVLDTSLTYECPQCQAEIDSRQRQSDLIAGSSGSLHFQAKN